MFDLVATQGTRGNSWIPSEVRCMTFWLYCFTHMYFVSVYSRDSNAACVEPPGYPDPIEIDCNLMEGETDTRRLTFARRASGSIARATGVATDALSGY